MIGHPLIIGLVAVRTASADGRWQFSYDGVFSPAYPLDPAGNPGLWTQVNTVVVAPEPDAMLALMLGTLGMAGWTAAKRFGGNRLKKPRA